MTTNFEKYKRYIYIFSCTTLFLFSSYAILKSVKTHYSYISHPYQLEYREGGALNITELFLNNLNPYSIEEQPQNTYAYGFLYPLSVSPFAYLFGNTLSVHRSFVYFFIILTSMLLFYALIKLKVNIVFSFAAAIILHQSIINAVNTPLARPEGLGIFLLVLGIIIPYRWKFSNLSLMVSILIGVLAYFTKPYYAIVIPILAAYLFIFVSKRKSLIYTTAAFLFLILSVTIVSLIFPLFLYNTLLHHIYASTYSFSFVLTQLKKYIMVNEIIFLIIFLSFIVILIKYLKRDKSEKGEQLIDSENKFQFNKFFKITKDESLLKSNCNLLFAFAFLFILVLFIAKLGGHRGNWDAAYLFQLASPFLILVTFQMLEKTSSKVFKSFVAILLIFTLNKEFKTRGYPFEEFTDCFKQVEETIKKSKNTLNSPENVSIMIEENKLVYNSGLSEYFPMNIDNLLFFSGFSKGVTKRLNVFQEEVDNKIIQKELDLILLTKDYYSFFVDTNLLKQNYKLSGIICAPFPDDTMEIETWVPKE